MTARSDVKKPSRKMLNFNILQESRRIINLEHTRITVVELFTVTGDHFRNNDSSLHMKITWGDSMTLA